MIQRIQTAYLLVAGLLVASLYKLNLAELAVNGEIYRFGANGIFNGETLVFNGLPISILIAIISLLHSVIIFSYKKRIRQIRLTVFTIVLLFGLFGMFFYFSYASFEGVQVAFRLPVAFPVVAIILDYLAIRAIGKDEALVRSLDRIR